MYYSDWMVIPDIIFEYLVAIGCYDLYYFDWLNILDLIFDGQHLLFGYIVPDGYFRQYFWVLLPIVGSEIYYLLKSQIMQVLFGILLGPCIACVILNG